MKKLTTLTAILLSTVLLAGCSCTREKTPEELAQEEKENFINANVEVTCEILKNPELSINMQESKDLAKEIFERHNLPVEDNEAMLAILDKYEGDEEVNEMVKTKLETDCKIDLETDTPEETSEEPIEE